MDINFKMDKERRKSLRRKLSLVAIKMFASLSGILPLTWNYFIGRVLGNIAYLAAGRHRKIALESLSVAFPDLPLKIRKKTASNFFIFMAQSSLELFYYLKNFHLLQNIRIEGRQYLDQALKKAKGVIIITAHLGNFPLMSLKLVREGYSVYVVTRPMRDERVSDYLYELRTAAGMKTIFSYPRRECVNGIIRALRSNGIVIIQMDQNFGTGGVWVNFFGKLAATPVGPIVLALRTKAAVVPAYIYRENEGKHCIKVFPEEELIITKDKEETILLNAIKITRIIENWVRVTGFQWSWIHRRWKSRPSKEIKKRRFKIEESNSASV